MGNKIGIADSFYNIGKIYGKQGDNEKALEYLLKSKKIEQEINVITARKTKDLNAALIIIFSHIINFPKNNV